MLKTTETVAANRRQLIDVDSENGNTWIEICGNQCESAIVPTKPPGVEVEEPSGRSRSRFATVVVEFLLIFWSSTTCQL